MISCHHTITKIRKKEFFTVYGISLLLRKANESDREYLVGFLAPVAEKYLQITEWAVRSELRHLVGYGLIEEIRNATSDCTNWYEAKKWIKAKYGITVWNYSVRRFIHLQKAVELFERPNWDYQYGGEKWANIAKACFVLKETLPVTRLNLEKVIIAIDRMNDLEHNNSLYLASFCTFNLEDALDSKYQDEEQQIINKCLSELQKIYRDYAREKVMT